MYKPYNTGITYYYPLYRSSVYESKCYLYVRMYAK